MDRRGRPCLSLGPKATLAVVIGLAAGLGLPEACGAMRPDQPRPETTAPGTPAAAAAAEQDPHVAIKASLEELNRAGAAVNRAYEPFRRQVPADPAAWRGMQVLYEAVGRVAIVADLLRGQVLVLQRQAGVQPAVGRAELRRRLAAVDSLAAAGRQLASDDWRQQLSDDLEEARGQLATKAVRAKTLADRTAAAANQLAYGIAVTEGLNKRAIILSVVGILVVFTVLSLIAGVVGSVSRLDGRWQQQEQDHLREALQAAPTIDATTVILIAAACATLITGRFRVRRIRRLLSPATKRTPWSAQGRLILQSSHDIGRKHA